MRFTNEDRASRSRFSKSRSYSRSRLLKSSRLLSLSISLNLFSSFESLKRTRLRDEERERSFITRRSIRI